MRGNLQISLYLLRYFIEKYINIIYNRLFCCSHTCYCVGMVSVTSKSRYVTPTSRYQSRFSMYIRGLIPRDSTELTEAVPIAKTNQTGRMDWAGYKPFVQKLNRRFVFFYYKFHAVVYH